jgi:hypothetical protein
MSEAPPATISLVVLINTTLDRARATPVRDGRSFLSGLSTSIADGIAVERQLKGWSRAKKEALIGSDWTKISQLARRRGCAAKTE